MNTQIDLLPQWARNEKNNRIKIKILIAVQISIFIFLSFTVYILNMTERKTWERSRALAGQIAAFDSAPLDAAEELQYARATSAFFDEMINGLIPADFEEEWLDFILETIPGGASMTRFEYNAREILIVCETGDINIAETHRANLSEFFTYVHQGRIMRLDDGLYSYEIKVLVEL